MACHKAVLHLSASGGGSVEVDGQSLGGVTGVVVAHSVMGVPRITVDLAMLDGVDVVVDSAAVAVSDKVRASLIRLGWVPPDGA